MPERRKYKHVPFLADVTVVDVAENTRHAGQCVNLCRGGMGLFCKRFIPPERQIRIHMRLPGSGGASQETLEARVAWAKAEDGGALMGAAFERELSPSTHPELCERLDNRDI